MKLKYYLRGIGVGLILAVVIYSTMIIPRKYKMTDEEVMERARELGMTAAEETDVDLSALSGTPEPTGDITPQASLEPGPGEASPEPVGTLSPEPVPTSTLTPVPEPQASTPTQASELTSTPTLEPSASELTSTRTPEPPTSTPTPESELTSTRMPELPPASEPTSEPQASELTSTPTPEPQASTPTQVSEPTSTPTPEPQASEPTPTPEPTSEPTPASDGTKVTLTVTPGMGSAQFALAAWRAGLVDDAEAFDKYLMQNGYASDIMIGTYSIPAGASYAEIAKIITAK